MASKWVDSEKSHSEIAMNTLTQVQCSILPEFFETTGADVVGIIQFRKSVFEGQEFRNLDRARPPLGQGRL